MSLIEEIRRRVFRVAVVYARFLAEDPFQEETSQWLALTYPPGASPAGSTTISGAAEQVTR